MHFLIKSKGNLVILVVCTKWKEIYLNSSELVQTCLNPSEPVRTHLNPSKIFPAARGQLAGWRPPTCGLRPAASLRLDRDILLVQCAAKTRIGMGSDEFRRVQTSSDGFGRVRTGSEGFGWVQMSSNRLEQVETGLNQSELVWMYLDGFQPVWTCFKLWTGSREQQKSHPMENSIWS